MAQPVYDPEAFQEATVAWLKTYNTQTVTASRPDLSSGLQAGRALMDDNIIPGTPNNAPVQIAKYPAVWVSLASDREMWAELGGVGTKREMELRMSIWCAVTSAPSEGHDPVEQEMKRLARNIKDVLRIDPSLGNTTGLVYLIPESTEFNALMPGDNASAYVSAAKIEVLAKYMSA